MSSPNVRRMFQQEPLGVAMGTGVLTAALGAAAWGVETMIETVVAGAEATVGFVASPLGLGATVLAGAGVMIAKEKISEKVEEERAKPFWARGFISTFFN